MAGIVGLYHFDARPVHEEELRRLTKILFHRGPNASGIWINGEVGLGHCARHGILEFTQNGPLVGEAGYLILTADARIDNRAELLSLLDWNDRLPREVSDEELILGAYARWGERSPEYLLGDFAFALWDRGQQRLFCARDHLGLKPFYYSQLKSSFAFASEIKALRALTWVPHCLNNTRIADYLMQMTEDKEATFYTGILRLPPAHVLSVTPGGVRRWCYWELDPHKELNLKSDSDYEEAYRERFVEAVRCRTRSMVSVGSLLSGGLDSSAVTCVARNLLDSNRDQPMDTFSLIFDNVPQSDERPFIDAVLAQGGFNPHYVHGDRIHPFNDIDRMLWHIDEPFFTPNLFHHWYLYQAAHSQGVGVVLDGFLGDSVVSHATRYLTELAATGQWITMLRETYTIAKVLGSRRRHSWRLLKEYVLTPLVHEPVQRTWDKLKNPDLPPFPSTPFINLDFARRVGWMDRAKAFGQDAPRTRHSVKEEHFAELTSGVLPSALEIVNKAATAFGITPRFPFSDRRLMEFCLAVPATQKYRDGWTRVIVRKGLRDFLPEKIYSRYGKKYTGHAFFWTLLFLAQEELSALVFDKLTIAEEYVNVEALQQTYRKILAHQTDDWQHQAVRDSIFGIWHAAMLTRWLETQKDKN